MTREQALVRCFGTKGREIDDKVRKEAAGVLNRR
jgi:hypothetical protein